MKKLLYVLPLFISLTTQAQNWQWIDRVGSLNVTDNASEEVPRDMTTDLHGNIYCLSRVYPSSAPTVGNETLTPLNSNAVNLALVSYSCDGAFRWSKSIGASAGATAKAIRTDHQGNVYGVGRIYSQSWNGGQFDDDFNLNGSERNFYIFKYDSLGNFQWATSPLSDTIQFWNGYSNSYPIDLHVKGNGDFTVFCLLPAGENLEGALVLDERGYFALDYNADGEFQSATPLPIWMSNLSSLEFSFWVNKLSNGNIIMNGYNYYPFTDVIEIGGETIELSFITCLDPQGNVLWQHEIQQNQAPYSNGLFLGRSVVDENDNIYITGGASHLDTLAGYVFENPMSPNITSMPMLVKFDSNGNLLWAQHAQVDAGTISFAAAESGNTVVTVGKYPGTLKWLNSDSQLHHVANQGYDPFIAVFDKETGAFIQQDSLTGNYTTNEELICAQRMPGGNYAVAGYFRSDLITPDGLIAASGSGDCFFGKYGTPSCPVEIVSEVVESNNSATVKVFPNPSQGMLSMDASLNPIRWNVLDMQGQLVWQGSNGIQSVDLSFLADGMYMVTLWDQSEQMHQVRWVKMEGGR